MKLVSAEYEEFNPVVVTVGTGFVFSGGYVLGMMGVSGPLLLWPFRAGFAVPVAIGAVILLKQFERERLGTVMVALGAALSAASTFAGSLVLSTFASLVLVGLFFWTSHRHYKGS